MSRHETLSDELQAAFHNPRDVGYLYLEAKFSKSGISSLKEVLCEFSDLKASSLTIVPETELKRCLTITSSDTPQVFAPGEWVLIKWGLYHGDIGLVLNDYCDNESMSGVKVLVVPRLDKLAKNFKFLCRKGIKATDRGFGARLQINLEVVRAVLWQHFRIHFVEYVGEFRILRR
ncbi:hypothetical protein DFH05DRAFT_1518502 [Lentinula detonsa]|uniref:Uncharacterized protein n=1 Tax=Lentinula detonsa TaxID=2804962 RepID=A0A9W8U2S0_9AGAR|nr:hypothetical protein DFH05DRAFT_1518502 [Lentinula detonsa]